jgi:cytosine/adenosine deaminase-related metal-dependent hydrolase
LIIRTGLLVTGSGPEIASGWLRTRDSFIVEIGSGEPPSAEEMLDARGCVAVPGLVNAHDHLYQWATRGYAPDEGLFGWLTELYPVWARIDADVVRAAARAAIGRLLLAGCTLTSDHHYIFPPGRSGIFEALVDSARELGIRFHPCRGSMSLGRSEGGLPPDEIVEREEAVLRDTEELARRYHDPRPGSMCRLVVAPCSPFSVTPALMRESAVLARRLGLRLHTHLAETVDEDAFCVEKFGRRPLDHLEELEWIADDVWVAHGIHFDASEVNRLSLARMGVAHCPSSNMRLGAGACPVVELLEAGVKVGLGVDGAASNEDYHLVGEVRQALLLARVRASLLGRPGMLDARDAWWLATAGGAACLGRPDCGALEVGRCADVALFKIDDLPHSGMSDPLQALALAPPARAEAVVVNGRVVVREGRLLSADEDELARDLATAAARLREPARA